MLIFLINIFSGRKQPRFGFLAFLAHKVILFIFSTVEKHLAKYSQKLLIKMHFFLLLSRQQDTAKLPIKE